MKTDNVAAFDKNIKIRDSGVEFLKIIAMGLIVISHVVITIGGGYAEYSYVPYTEYILDIASATNDLQRLTLSVFRHFGILGNTMFFVCTAWFLLDSKKVSFKKWLYMFMEVWIISFLILLITYMLRSGDIAKDLIIKSLFPVTLENNWYMTCYLLFYPIHTILNFIIKSMSKEALMRTLIVLVVLYFGINFLKNNLFYSSYIVIWITIYFVVAYMKLYMEEIASDKKINIAVLIVGLCGGVGLILFTNFLGVRFDMFKDKVLYWCQSDNPFLLLIALPALNLARQSSWKNKTVNYFSSLSLLIYLIHENRILKTYYRTYIVNYIYERFGYTHIVLWVLVLSVVIFSVSAAAAVLYKSTIQKAVFYIRDKLEKCIIKYYKKIENILLKI